MRRLALALLLCSLGIIGAATGTDLSHCLDPSTKLDAGAMIPTRNWLQACAQLQQANLHSATRIRVDHAASNLINELQHRQATHQAVVAERQVVSGAALSAGPQSLRNVG